MHAVYPTCMLPTQHACCLPKLKDAASLCACPLSHAQRQLPAAQRCCPLPATLHHPVLPRVASPLHQARQVLDHCCPLPTAHCPLPQATKPLADMEAARACSADPACPWTCERWDGEVTSAEMVEHGRGPLLWASLAFLVGAVSGLVWLQMQQWWTSVWMPGAGSSGWTALANPLIVVVRGMCGARWWYRHVKCMAAALMPACPDACLPCYLAQMLARCWKVAASCQEDAVNMLGAFRPGELVCHSSQGAWTHHTMSQQARSPGTYTP
jgi:hypothetical protein